MSNVYVWRDSGVRPPVQAQLAGEELQRIASEHNGHLRPDTVVEESRPLEAPLHPAFEWDDPTAAARYREDQARSIIRSVHVLQVVDGEEPRPQLAYVHVSPPLVGPCYMSTAHVMSDVQLRQQALEDAYRLLRGIKARFAHLEELALVMSEIEALEPVATTDRKSPRAKTAGKARQGEAR